MMKMTNKIYLLVLMCFFAEGAIASQRWYQIELIVFEQNVPGSERSDQTGTEIKWPGKLAELSGDSHSLDALAKQPKPFARVAGKDMLLHYPKKKLARSRNYHPIRHVSWIQPVAQNSMGKAVHIHSGLGQDDAFQLDGFVRLQRGHYLHLIVDLELTEFKKPATAEFIDTGPVVFRLNEKRRIKFDEVHYLDHPEYGVIVVVKPFRISRNP